ncbi:MAG: HYR domain-containing protein [Lewinellaceae bacterium]|nr:HYR domain-containing protein [Lewinellaceae bacterium]
MTTRNILLYCYFLAGSLLAPVNAQITVTNSVFPVVGDTLHYLIGNQPGAINQIFTPPGGSQAWDLSNLQPTQTWDQIFRDPATGTGSGMFPAASSMFNPVNSSAEIYWQVTASQVNDLGYYGLDPIGLGITLPFKKFPGLQVTWAPLQFFDVKASSASTLTVFPASIAPASLLSLLVSADSFRIRIAYNRLMSIDAWGTLAIPGGTFDVLRKKQTDYVEQRIDAYIPPLLLWVDVTDIVLQNIGGALGVDTITSFHFLNDVSKEEIAVCLFDKDITQVLSVQYKMADTMAPMAVCQDLTVYLDATGNTSIMAQDLDGGSTDNVGITSYSASRTSFDCMDLGLTDVILTVADIGGNSDTCTAMVTVLDTIRPVPPAPPANVFSDCASDVPPVISLMATDNCDGSITVDPISVVIPGSCPNDFVMNRTWTFIDSSGNSSSVSQIITVSDTTPPLPPQPPANLALDCAADIPPGAPLMAIDNCNGAITVDPSAQLIPGGCPNSFVMLRTWTFIDSCGNSSSVNQTITVVDSVPPVPPQPPANLALDCAADIPPGTPLMAIDNCNGAITVNPTDQITPGGCPNNLVVVRTWTFIDSCGNSSSVNQTITVVDSVPPVAVCMDITIQIEAGASAGIIASDIDGGSMDNCTIDTLTINPSVFTCPDVGTMNTMSTLKVIDECGNVDSCIALITVLCCDTPSITCPADITVTADPFACEVPVSYSSPTVMSNCTPVITQLSGPASDSMLYIGMYTVQFEASNGPTKKATCSFTITVLENGQSQPLQSTAKRAAAGLACQDHVNISLSSDCQRVITARDVLVTGSAGCIDRYNCEVFRPGSLIPIPGATLTYEHVGQTLTYVVEDIQSGGKCWGTLKVEDKLGPVIRCENDTLTCLEAAISSTDDYMESLVSDCGPYPTQVEIVHSIWEDYQCEDSLFSGKITRTIRSSDPWGNHNECTQEIWIERNNLDSLICPDTIEVECTLLELYKQYGLLDSLAKELFGGSIKLDLDALDPFTLQVITRFLYNSSFTAYPEIKTLDGSTSPLWIPDYYYELFPDLANAHCNTVAEYEDKVFEICGKSRKIRRTWTIYDWCGHRDTTCEQWIIVKDTIAPFLNFFDYFDLGRSEMDTTSLLDLADKFTVLAYTEPHDCKAHVHLPDVKKYFFDCNDFEVGYEVEVADAGHPGKTTVLSGTLPADIYLPEGVFTIKLRLVDACWNTSLEVLPGNLFGVGGFRSLFTTLVPGITVQVLDATPPTPVCDEITQVTLDPASCWARINAEDLDDGSHDNCCDQLYYAVALKDSVDYYEAQFQEFLSSVTEEYFGVDIPFDGLGLYETEAPNLVSFMRVAHEVWMNLCAFDVVEDLTECGEDQVVLRVYEACGLRPYDEHIKKNVTCILPPIYQTTPGGTPTAVYQWTIDTKQEHFFYELMNACWDDYFPLLGCITNESLYLRYVWCLVEYYKDKGQFVQLNKMTLDQIELELQNILNADIGECIVDNIPEILVGLKVKQNFMYTDLLKTKYNDCWIEVLKDDKTPPVVVAPEDVTVYCDGVPYNWTVTKHYDYGTKSVELGGEGASFAHDVCEGGDVLSDHCITPQLVFTILTPPNGGYDVVSCCVEQPWDGGEYGYYGGPQVEGYAYDACVDGLATIIPQLSHDWKPIYCQIWLLLDQYDNKDGGHPDPQSYFEETAEDWVITDNCSLPDTQVEITGSLNECGVGTLTKTVTATDKCGNTAHDTQTLYVKPRSDFEVIFPADVVVDCTDGANLAADRTGAGYPEISDDDCELIGVTYSDERYDVTEGCYKILRHWKLIDWCVYSPDLHNRYPDVIVDDRLLAGEARQCVVRNLKDDGDGFMEYIQVIKVVDNEAPVIVCNELGETCIYDNNCDAATVNYELLASGTDNCAAADEIQYRYTVLADETTPIAFGQGHELNAELAVGTYGVWLVGKDRCGNEDSCYTTFTIRDCKNPTPYCYHGIATVVMSPSGEVEVWARDFDAGSYDNCTTADNLILSFTEDGETPSITFTCADIPDGRSQEIEVEIWVIDEAGNKDFCTTTLLLQDNSGNACQDSSPLTESGSGVASPGQKVKGEEIRTPELYQNTPNPFSGETKIGFWLPESMTATLKVMDVTGKELYRVSGSYSGGNHLITLEAGSIPEMKGVLFYQLETKSGVINKRMVKVN